MIGSPRSTSPILWGCPASAVQAFSAYMKNSRCPFPPATIFVVVYGLTDVEAAVGAWGARHEARSSADLKSHAQEVNLGYWQPRIRRLRAEQVANPDIVLAEEEERARAIYGGRYLNQADLQQLLNTI